MSFLSGIASIEAQGGWRRARRRSIPESARDCAGLQTRDKVAQGLFGKGDRVSESQQKLVSLRI